MDRQDYVSANAISTIHNIASTHTSLPVENQLQKTRLPVSILLTDIRWIFAKSRGFLKIDQPHPDRLSTSLPIGTS